MSKEDKPREKGKGRQDYKGLRWKMLWLLDIIKYLINEHIVIP